MDNKEFRKMLEMAIGICEWAMHQQNNQRFMANNIIVEQQQKNIDRMKEVFEKTPKDGISHLIWAELVSDLSSNYEIGAAVLDNRNILKGEI